MKIEDTFEMARRILNENNLSTWNVDIIRSKCFGGRCAHKEKTIYISLPYILTNDMEAIEKIIKHEVAHAIVGPWQAHNYKWRRVARTFGIEPSKYLSSDVKIPAGKYQAICQCCNMIYHMNRQPKRRYSCKKCSGGRFDERYLLVYKKVG